MFDDLAIGIKTENIDRREILHPRPFLQTVQNDMIAVGESALYGYALARVFARHALEKIDEAQLAGFDVRIMLNEFVADILLNGVAYLILIENEIVEGDDVSFSRISLGHLADHFFLLRRSPLRGGIGGYTCCNLDFELHARIGKASLDHR